MYNPILFVINSNGDVIKKSGIVRAINGYREYAVVITPLSNTAVSMSIMTDNGTFDKKEQYVLPTNLKVSDFVSSDDPLYQSIYDWNVYGVEIKEIALESIALFRTGKTTVAFQFQRIKASDKCVAYKGYFGIDLPLPQTAEIGDYYECEDNNYTIVSGTHNYTFTKGMYVYFNGVRWVKDRLMVELNVPPVEIAVEPSHATGYQLDDDDVNYLLPLGDNIVEALQKAELALQKIEGIKSGLEPLDELTLKDGQGNEMNVTFDGQDPIIAYRGVSAELFKNLFLEVEPASGVTFTNDMQVMYAGSIGGSGKRLAKPTNLVELKENPNLYLGTITQITEDNHGIVNWYGVVNHINTSGQTLGAPVYVGDNGSWTTVKPISPLPIIIVGLIERVHSSKGQINVRPNVGNYLNQLHDVYTNGHTFVGGETIMFNLANGRYEVYDLAGKLQQVDDDINLLNSNKANKTYVDSQDAVLQSQISGNVSDIESLEIGKEDKSMKGQPNGYAPLDVSGYIPSAFVPNSFDDVIEFNTYADLLAYGMPQSNKLFVVKQDETSGGNHSTYRWTGTMYIRVTDEMSAAEIKVLYESNADTNPLTDVLKNNYNEAYTHSQIVNSNPHQTTYAQLLDKPTKIAQLGVDDVYDKTYIDALKDKNGWESELLGILSNNGTIALSIINQFDEIQMYAKDTLGVIDNENIRPSLMQSGDSVYFFDDTKAFIMVDTVFGFYAPVGYTLQVVGVKYTELKASDVATSEVGVTVQDKIEELSDLVENIGLDTPIEKLENQTLREVFEGGIYSATPLTSNNTLNGITYTRSTYPIITLDGTATPLQPTLYMNNISSTKNIYLIYDFVSGSNQGKMTNQSGDTIKTDLNVGFTLKMVGNTQIFYTINTGQTAVNHTSKITLIDLDISSISHLLVEELDYWFNVYQTIKEKSTTGYLLDALNQREVSLGVNITEVKSQLAQKLTQGIGAVTNADLSNKAVTMKKTNFIKMVNLFNKDTAISGAYIGVDGVEVSSSNWYYSDFIEVESGETYTINDGLSNVGALLYDANQNFLEAVYAEGEVSLSQPRTFTVDNDQAKYMVVNITINKFDIAMLVEGGLLPTEYIPYGEIYIMGKAVADKPFVEQKLTEISPLNGTNVYMNYSNSFEEGGQEFNTVIGFEALAVGGNTKYATAIGYQAMKNNKPDGTPDAGLYNTAVGYQALMGNIIGDHNTAVGFCALRDNEADYNTACGEDSLLFNTSGDSNAAIGTYSLKNNTSGRGNSAVGVNALQHNTTGYWNVGIGENSGSQTYSGVGNCDIDYRMTFVGAMASVDKSSGATQFQNSTAIGASAKVNKSNMVRLGSTSVTVVETYGDYETLTAGNGFVCQSPNGTRYRISVSDTGELVINAI